MRKLSGLLPFAVAAALALGAGLSHAQTWPTKPIKLVNPFAAGGFGDVVARPLLDRLGQVLGQNIVVESHAGANGAIASGVVAKSAPDGHTWLLANLGPIAINPVFQANAPDPLTEFAPITILVSGPQILVVRHDYPATDLRSLIAYARANKGKLSYGSVGPGSTTHLAGELLNLKAGTDTLHIPYKGAVPVINDIIGKQVDMGFVNISLAKPHIDAGRLRGIAVSTLKRAAIMPDVPAVAEVLPGYEMNTWWGLAAPFGTPKPVIDRIAAETAKILQVPEVAERLRQAGLEPDGASPEAFAGRIRADITQWRELVRVNNIRNN
jgi:tripartite-type tricarboxylate transporter receptor subunit TctC